MTVNTRVIKIFLGQPELISIPLLDNLKIQIIPDISYLPRCQKHHFAAFVRDRATVVVWDDDPRTILDRIRYLEQQLVAAVWREGNAASDEEKLQTPQYLNTEDSEDSSDVTPEGGRKTILIQSWLAAITLFLVISAIGLGFRSIATEIKIDHQWSRLALLAVVLVQMWLALVWSVPYFSFKTNFQQFFMQSLIGCLAQLLGPTSQLTSNSKYYSGKAPRRLRSEKLPHVSIQCPVYKEGLDSVISPTITSVKAAISTYEMQGGSANIFINDDGMQLISVKDALARQEYYEEHNIGWIARPRHNPKPTDGSAPFIRPGKFKKASNMNYALDVSIRIEDKLNAVPRPVDWNLEDEEHSYATAFLQVIEEDQGRTWGAGNIRVGDYILLIDSDTRVPTDCLLDIVSEMEVSPEVAIIQFASGVMNVTESFFERGITFFTHLVYTAIRFAVGNGDVAPFVGHNAILRWSAIQDVAHTGDDGDRYWSESTVSEDFDMALRLQCAGYIVRLAAYTGTEDEFKEGVSLTVYDELARWEKYAYGCSELIFHPLKSWVFKGPFTPLFRKFIFSMMPLPSKLTIMAYVGTYYALASAFPLTLANYFIVGWFNMFLDHYYLNSFKIYFAIIIVFTGLGNVALAVLRYRMGERSLFGACKSTKFAFHVLWITLQSPRPIIETDAENLHSTRKLQMGPSPHDLSGRLVPSSSPSYPLPSVLGRDGLGSDCQRSHRDELLRRTTKTGPKF
jgi:hypothetical protein